MTGPIYLAMVSNSCRALNKIQLTLFCLLKAQTPQKQSPHLKECNNGEKSAIN